jgi:polyisoprenoid-binding protein YceI
MLPFALCASLSARAGETLIIDQTHSAVLLSWSHLGVSNPVARFETIQGQVILDRADPGKSSVTVTLPVDSLHTGVDALDRHLKTAEFLNAETYPVITFHSTGVKMTGRRLFKLSGDLTIHGVTRPVVLDAKVNAIGRNGFSGALMAGFEAEAIIRRSDFGVSKYVPAVSDELTVHITLHAEPPA